MSSCSEQHKNNALSDCPFFSIIVGIHPRYGPLIYDCVRSILRQTVGDFELLLVSGSQNWTLATIQDPRVTYLFVGNDTNYCLKRNAGIDAASGDYLIFVDCDDLMSPFFLERARNYLSEGTADCLIFGATRSMDSFLADPPSLNSLTITGQEEIYRFCFSRYAAKPDPRASGLILDSVWAKVFSASIIKKYHIRFPDEPVRADDVLFGNQFFLKCNKIVADSSFLSYYWRPNSISEMANLYSPFYNLEGFICELKSSLACVQEQHRNNLDFYIGNLTRRQFTMLTQAYNARSIRLKEAATLFNSWFPARSASLSYLIGLRLRFGMLLRLRMIRTYLVLQRFYINSVRFLRHGPMQH